MSSIRFINSVSVGPCLQRAMPMRVLTVGKKRSQGTQLLVEEYKEKLGHYCDVEDTLIKSNPKLTRYDMLYDAMNIMVNASPEAISHCSVDT